MIKSLLIAITALSTFSATALSQDNFEVHGEIGIGGYYDTNNDLDTGNWATGGTLRVHYDDGYAFAFIEEDIFYNDDERDLESDLDKARAGVYTYLGALSYGFEDDTALDRVDGIGNTSFEFGFGASSTGDARHVIKLENEVQNFAYGISAFERYDGVHAYNTYIGLHYSSFVINLGYEESDLSKVYVATGSLAIGNTLRVGANLSKEVLDNGEQSDRVYVSAQTTYKAVTIVGGAGVLDDEFYFNMGGYALLGGGFAIGADLETYETTQTLFTRFSYSF